MLGRTKEQDRVWPSMFEGRMEWMRAERRAHDFLSFARWWTSSRIYWTENIFNRVTLGPTEECMELTNVSVQQTNIS
jgi:hypothetical protein